jgi:t-SNARE complex subunit (syntaxin)
LAKDEIQEKHRDFLKIEEELREKITFVEAQREEKTKMQEMVEDLTAEVKQLQTQKSEKDAKLKN